MTYIDFKYFGQLFDPIYSDKSDFNTNAKSYYDALARNKEFLKLFTEKLIQLHNELQKEFDEVEEFTKEKIDEFQKRLDGIKEEMKEFFTEWLADGTIEDIIQKYLSEDIVDKDTFNSTIGDIRDELLLINNLIDSNQSLLLANIETLTNQVLQHKELLDSKTSQIFMLSLLGVEPNTNINDTLSAAIELVPEGSTLLFNQNETYFIDKPLNISKDVHLEFNGSILEVDFTENQGSAIHFLGREKAKRNITSDYAEGGQSLTLNDVTGIEVGDTVLVSSTELFNNSRNYYRKGGYFRVEQVNTETGQIRIHRDMPFSFSVTTGTVTVFKPVTGSIKNLTLLNKGEINGGTFGINIENAINVEIKNVYIDYFNHLIILKKHLNSTVSNFTAGRSFYLGTQESYGLTSYIGTGFTLKNSIIRSGRHAVSITGFEPSYQTIVENCAFDNEDSSNQHSFDCHEANFDLTMINCVSNGAIFAGNCKVIRSRFNNTSGGKAVTISMYNDKTQSNYTFEGCEFVSTELRIGEWQQNPDATANVIGSLILRDCIAKKGLTLRLNPSQVYNILVENTDNVAFIIHATVELLRINSVRYLANSNFINHANTESRLKNIVIENSFLPARYRSLLTHSSDTIVFRNVTFAEIAGAAATNEVFNLTGKYISLDNCHFPVGYSGKVNASPNVYVNAGTNMSITGDFVKNVSYI